MTRPIFWSANFGTLTGYNFRQEQPFAWNLVSYDSTQWDLSNDV